MIVGGTFDKNGGRASVIVKMLAKCLGLLVINGGSLKTLKEINHLDGALNIWLPNVPNEVEKFYPSKKRGSILICSKVLRPGRTLADAVARIFKMQGNAVIAIDSGTDFFKFTLIDALGNIWIETSKVTELARSIKDFCKWMSEVRRIESKRVEYEQVVPVKFLNDLCNVNTLLINKVELSANGERYFGNLSTRCSSLFPSLKISNDIYVSKRNINKKLITSKDFVHVIPVEANDTYYFSTDDIKAKPSVDTPVQLQLYKNLPDIRCMIHGHAYVKGAKTTEYYCPCGDLREVEDALAILENRTMCINLKNHGFLAIGTDIKSFEAMIKNVVMLPKVPGGEKVCLSDV